jgi:hypothetical protein
VQIGAFDGQVADPLADILRLENVSAVFVEPQTIPYRALVDTEGMDHDILNWFFDADVEPAVINFEHLHLDRREPSASRELLWTNGYWWIETSQDTFAMKEFLAQQ